MSEIRANTISNAAGTGPVTLTGQYAAKAWINFTGTGTITILESGNVSSIVDNRTGDYSINFTGAMTDANYATVSQVAWTGFANNNATGRSDQTASQTTVFSWNQFGNTSVDAPELFATVTR